MKQLKIKQINIYQTLKQIKFMKSKNIFRTMAAIVVMFAVCINVNAQIDRKKVKESKAKAKETTTQTTTQPAASTAPTADDAQRRQAIKDGLKAIPTNLNAILTNTTLFDSPEEQANKIILAPDGVYKIVKRRVDIREEGITILGTEGDMKNYIYPGAILIANSDLVVGKPTPLSGIVRGKVKLFADFKTKSRQEMQAVTATSGNISGEVNRIIQSLFNNGPVVPTKSDVVAKMYSSEEEMMLDFKCSASFLGAKGDASLNTKSNSQKFLLSINIMQDFYTLQLDDEYVQNIADLFADNVTFDDIKKQITINGKQQPLAIVTSVTYGRRIYSKQEKTSSDFALKGYQSFEYKGVATATASANQDISKKNWSESAKQHSRGGASIAKEILNCSSIADMKKKVAEDFYITDANEVVPVAYTLAVLTGPSMGGAFNPSFTGKYYYTESIQKLPSKIPLRIKNDSNHTYYVKLYAAKRWTIQDEKVLPNPEKDVLIFDQGYGKGMDHYAETMIDFTRQNKYIEGYDGGVTLKLEIWYNDGKKYSNRFEGYIRVDGRNTGDTSGTECIQLRISKDSENTPKLNGANGGTLLWRQ